MKLQAHMLADTVQFDSEGFVTIIKGGITGVTPAGFPILFRFGVFTRLWLTPEEAAGLVEMTTRISYNDVELANNRQPLNVNRADPNYIFVNVANTLQFVLDRPGLLRISAYVVGVALPTLDLPITAPP